MTDQYDLHFGEQLRDKGIAKVLAHSIDYAVEFAQAANAILAQQGSVTSDAVVRMVGMPEGSPNAVGAVMRSWAISRGLRIQRYVKSSRPSCHAAVVGVWA